MENNKPLAMTDYKSFAVTVQGGSHIKSGAVCQDASNFYDENEKDKKQAVVPSDDSEGEKHKKKVSVSIAVVADGHGDSSCFRSNRGSQTAVSCARRGIYNFVKDLQETRYKPGFPDKPDPPSHRELEKLIREKLIKQIKATWDMKVMEDYQKNPFTEQELEKVTSEKYSARYNKDKPEYEGGKYVNKAYGTSLIAVAITEWYWFGLHIGDGRFTVLYEDGKGGQPVPWDPKCYLNVTTSICDDDILDRGEEGVRVYLSLHSEKAPPVAFFCCSDGIDDNYPADEKENAECLYRLYREIAVTAAEDGYDSTFGQDGHSGQLKELADGFATKGKGDDTSLAGIVNIPKLKEVAPVWKEKMAAGEAKRKEAKAEAEAKAKAETEAMAKADEEAVAKKAARRAEIEAQVKAENEAAEKAKADAKAKAEAEKKAEAEEKAKAEADKKDELEKSGEFVTDLGAKPPAPVPESKPEPLPIPPAGDKVKDAPAAGAGENPNSKADKEQVLKKLIDGQQKELINKNGNDEAGSNVDVKA